MPCEENSGGKTETRLFHTNTSIEKAKQNKMKEISSTSLKAFSVEKEQKNPLPDYNGRALPEIFEEFSILPT